MEGGRKWSLHITAANDHISADGCEKDEGKEYTMEGQGRLDMRQQPTTQHPASHYQRTLPGSVMGVKEQNGTMGEPYSVQGERCTLMQQKAQY